MASHSRRDTCDHNCSGAIEMPDVFGSPERSVDAFAAELFTRTRHTEAETLGITGVDLESWKASPWEKATPFLHELFRARAIRMLNGDLLVMPMAHEMRPR